MYNRDTLTKILAAIGTVLVWLPMLAPLFFGLVSFFREGRFRLDYLMPAELFPSILVGGGLLVWAAWRARSRLALIGWGLAMAIVALISSQLVAVGTGLASGETAVGGWQWVVVMVLFGLFLAAVVAIGVGGVLLLRDVFRPSQLHFGS
jgi:hypothetical protein